MRNNDSGLGSTPDASTADASVEITRFEFSLPSAKVATSLEERMVAAGVNALLDYDSDELFSSAESAVKDIYAAMKEVELQSQVD